LGRPEPQPVPHPDDIILDFVKGEAKVCGPMTIQDKVEWDRLLQRRDDLQAGVSMFAQRHESAGNDEEKADALERWKAQQKLYDRMNDNLPLRYRKDLDDRSWEDDASRPGQQRKQKWPGD
jgi:hypothetical protein